MLFRPSYLQKSEFWSRIVGFVDLGAGCGGRSQETDGMDSDVV